MIVVIVFSSSLSGITVSKEDGKFNKQGWSYIMWKFAISLIDFYNLGHTKVWITKYYDTMTVHEFIYLSFCAQRPFSITGRARLIRTRKIRSST